MKRLFGITEKLEDIVASKRADSLAHSLSEKLGETEAAQFLREALAVLCPNAPTGVDAKLTDQAKPAESLPLDEIVATLPAVSMVVPHGRYDVIMTDAGVRLHGQSAKKGTMMPQIPWADIKHVLKLPKLEPMREPGSPAKTYWVVLVLDQAIAVGKQLYGCLVLKADGVKRPQHAPYLGPKLCERRDRCDEALRGISPDTPEHQVLCCLLAACLNVEKVLEPEPSVSTLEGAEARAEKGELGALYPLRAGLIFLPKPPIFVESDDILEAQAGTGVRGGDFIIHRAAGGEVKFQNLAGSDVKAVLEYIASLTCHKQPEVKGDDDALWPEEDDGSDFEDEDIRPAKRRVVTRSQTRAEQASGTTPDLLRDFKPAPKTGPATVKTQEQHGDSEEKDESDWEIDETQEAKE